MNSSSSPKAFILLCFIGFIGSKAGDPRIQFGSIKFDEYKIFKEKQNGIVKEKQNQVLKEKKADIVADPFSLKLNGSTKKVDKEIDTSKQIVYVPKVFAKKDGKKIEEAAHIIDMTKPAPSTKGTSLIPGKIIEMNKEPEMKYPVIVNHNWGDMAEDENQSTSDFSTSKFACSLKKSVNPFEDPQITIAKPAHKRTGDASHNWDKNRFEYHEVLGEDSFGKAFKVTLNGRNFALKQMEKPEDEIELEWIEAEILNLKKLRSPFIVGLEEWYEDDFHYFLLLQVVPGDQFYYFLQSYFFNYNGLMEQIAKFYAAQLVLGVEAMASKQILHRDLKPTNVLMDEDGYLKISDLGISEDLAFSADGKAHIYCGTCTHLAPERINKFPYKYKVDIWSLGVMFYEMLVGVLPFPYLGGPPDEYRTERSILFNEVQYPEWLSKDELDLLKGMLNKDVKKRYGIVKVKNHPWFKNFDWKALARHEMKAPFLPRKDAMSGRKFYLYQNAPGYPREGPSFWKEKIFQEKYEADDVV